MSIIEPWYLVQVHPIRVRHLWWRLDRGSPFAYRIIAPPQKDRFLFCKNRGATRQPFLRTLAFSLERLFLFFFLFGYRVFARPDVLISIKVFNVLVPRLRCSFIASIWCRVAFRCRSLLYFEFLQTCKKKNHESLFVSTRFSQDSLEF